MHEFFIQFHRCFFGTFNRRNRFSRFFREGVKVYQEGFTRRKNNGQVLLLSLTRDIDRTVSNLLCADLDKTLEITNANNCGFNSLIVFEELPFNRDDKNQSVPHD